MDLRRRPFQCHLEVILNNMLEFQDYLESSHTSLQNAYNYYFKTHFLSTVMRKRGGKALREAGLHKYWFAKCGHMLASKTRKSGKLLSLRTELPSFECLPVNLNWNHGSYVSLLTEDRQIAATFQSPPFLTLRNYLLHEEYRNLLWYHSVNCQPSFW